ncbi:MAG TPA: hypothetical protein VKE97_09345 [Acidimicrobiia bacterium]|nr:hypothetical protein [Acidimicrobiia bacterium]
MTDDDRLSLDAARAAGAHDALGPWVAEFLASPGSDNAVLADELTARLRWWLGPVQVPLTQLHRLAGPPGEAVLCAVDDDYWRDDVDDLEEKVEDGWEPPPVIASYQDGRLVLEDGNHRVEGIRRSGAEHVWTVIGFDDPEERDRFQA